MPKVSIIIPAYNAALYIQKTIDSILAQTVVDFECIVVDDGSTDDTLAVVASYNDARIKVIAQQNSGGPAKPRNAGIAVASGELICIFDSDDIMQPRKLEEYLLAFAKDGSIDVIFSNFSLINETDGVIAPNFLADYVGFKKHMYPIDNHLYKMDMKMFFIEIIKANFIGTSSVCFKRSLVTNEKLFDESLSSGDDILAWVVLAKKAQFAFLDMVLHSYRKREGSISTKNVEKLLLNKIHVLGKIDIQLSGDDYHREVINKANEYYYSLGYLYRKSSRFSDAKKAYKSIKGFNNKPRVIVQIIKVIAEEMIFFWRG